MAKIVGKNILGHNVSAPIVPHTTDDQIPTHEAIYGKGGWRYVSTIAERDAIPEDRRELRMVVCVGQDDFYTLKKGIANADWEAAQFAAEFPEIPDQVQSDWRETDDKKSSFIKNKPTRLSQFENDDYFVQDQNYVHTDNNFDNDSVEKLRRLKNILYEAGENIFIDESSDSEGNIYGSIHADRQSDNNFTDRLKEKLELVEGAKYKGVFATYTQLINTFPGGAGGIAEYGWSADIVTNKLDEFGETKQVLHRWAVNEALLWQDYGELGVETPESVRMKYEINELSVIHIHQEKLDTIEEGAQKNVQSDWNEEDYEKDSYIFNKPNFDIWLNDDPSSDSLPETESYIHFSNVFQTIYNFLKWVKEFISDLPLFEKEGDGTKFLSDDGTYKTVSSEGGTAPEYEAGDRITITDYVIAADQQTEEDFTTVLKEKLEALESPKHKGTYPSVTALETAYPTGEMGDSADVVMIVYDEESNPQEIIHRFVWNGIEWEDKGPMGADTAESIRQKYEGLQNALVNINKQRIDELELAVNSLETEVNNINTVINEGGLSGTVHTKSNDSIVLKGDGSAENPLEAEFVGVGDGGGIAKVITEDTNSIIFKGTGTVTDPLKAWHVCGDEGGSTETFNKELKFIVSPHSVMEVSIFNPLMRKALIAEYIVYSGELLRHGTMKISKNQFFEINVLGDNFDFVFSWNDKLIATNNTGEEVSVHIKLNYFNKL